jgi:diguanylate cyclase (GGDEF)-like protein
MVAGDHPGVPLGILAGAFTDHRPGAAVAFDDGGDPGVRAVVGALPAELVGVFDGRQDRSASAPWTAAEAQPRTLVQVESLDGLPSATRRAAEERGLATGLFISVPDVGRPNPAVLCTWMADPSEADMIGINLVDLADLAYLALQSRAAREHLDHLAHHDGLTGLANRARFFAALDQALALAPPGCGLALAYLDLDDFKLANDTHGHLAGDHILAEIAARFRAEVRSGDLVARLGGDEFAVLLTCVEGGDEAVAVAHRVRAAAGEPVDVSGSGRPGGLVQLGASAGVAVAGDLNGVTADGLVRLADEALYAAKRQGKGSLQVVRWGASDNVVPA